MIRDDERYWANVVIGAIDNLERPMLMFEGEKMIVRKALKAYLEANDSNSEKPNNCKPQKKICANCRHLKKHNGKLADWVCDRKGSIVTNPYDKECDEMWERKDEPQTEREDE